MSVKCASESQMTKSVSAYICDILDLCESHNRLLTTDTENYTGYILVRAQSRNISECFQQHLTNTNPNVDTYCSIDLENLMEECCTSMPSTSS